MAIPIDPHVNVPAIVFGGLSIIFALFSAWMAVETYLLVRGEHPITWYVRNYVSWHLGWAFFVVVIVSLAVGMGITHFVFDEAVHP